MSNKTLIFIGQFRELGYDDGAPLASARGKRPAAGKAQVVRYLENGALMEISPGMTVDAFAPEKQADSLHILTDGTYAWHRVLAYYVRHYDLALPLDFELHMRRNGHQISSEIRTRDLRLPGK